VGKIINCNKSVDVGINGLCTQCGTIHNLKLFPQTENDVKINFNNMREYKKAEKIAGYGNKSDRSKGDFYPTPSFVLFPILEKENFEGTILEPCCGEGHISKELLSKGFDVTSRDLFDRGYGETGIDFLFMPQPKTFDNIITNPPYNLALEFAQTSLMVAKKKVALLMKINFLEGVKRKTFLENSPLKYVYVFSKRQTLTRPDWEGKNKGFITYAWFVWEIGYEGETIIKWL